MRSSLEETRTSNGMLFVPRAVKEAKKQVFECNYDHEYIPFLGHDQFTQKAAEVVFGALFATIKDKIIAVHAIGEDGCIRLAADLMVKVVGYKACLLPTNEGTQMELSEKEKFSSIFAMAGCQDLAQYAHCCPNVRNRPSFGESTIFDTCSQNSHAVLLIQQCWDCDSRCIFSSVNILRHLCAICVQNDIFPIIINNEMNIVKMQTPLIIQVFLEQKLEFAVVQSFSQAFGLYDEQIALLSFVMNQPEVIPAVRSQLCQLVRPNHGSPNGYGSQVIMKILNDAELLHSWTSEWAAMLTKLKTSKKLHQKEINNNISSTIANQSAIVTRTRKFKLCCASM